MSDYGIIRQYVEPYDLLALPFFSLQGSMFEDGVTMHLLEPEWVEGSYFNSNSGGSSTNDGMKKAIIDVSDYDAVLVGFSVASGLTGNVYSGLRAAADSGNFAADILMKGTTSIGYGWMNTQDGGYLLASQAIDNPLPIFGITFPA